VYLFLGSAANCISDGYTIPFSPDRAIPIHPNGTFLGAAQALAAVHAKVTPTSNVSTSHRVRVSALLHSLL